MTIVVTGAGSGGHITPILAVANELKKIDPKVKIVYIGQKGDRFLDVPKDDMNIDKVYGISAGKLRRYHGEGLKQITDFPTVFKNLKDIFKVLLGTVQSYFLLTRIKPDVIFIKGGYIGVPVGISAKIKGIPYITHDSDVVPGLANRIIGPWAALHTTALPNNSYEASKTINVGVPVSSSYRLVTSELQRKYKKGLGLSVDDPVLLVVGGGLGAKTINELMVPNISKIFAQVPNLFVFHMVGGAHAEEVTDQYAQTLSKELLKKIKIEGYVNDLYKYSGAADVIVTRAGATNLAEFAIQGKACIVIPNPVLVGGHQVKNAAVLEKDDSIVMIEESKVLKRPKILVDEVVSLINSQKRITRLSNNLRSYAHPHAAKSLADLIYNYKSIKK
jgi:UDP-N-acetylglucosamine--N-acetylmuramyl-(pentapeptide) pyrophosphoryl-undecaprenol N-acetylglucosamine transferase